MLGCVYKKCYHQSHELFEYALVHILFMTINMLLAVLFDP